jgi:hypothetical protein
MVLYSCSTPQYPIYYVSLRPYVVLLRRFFFTKNEYGNNIYFGEYLQRIFPLSDQYIANLRNVHRIKCSCSCLQTADFSIVMFDIYILILSFS